MKYDKFNVYVIPEFTKFIYPENVKIIFEIGALNGQYTPELLDFYKNCEQLHSFECNPKSIHQCYNNITDPRVTFNNIAISDKNGFIDFFPINFQFSNDFGSSSQFLRKDYNMFADGKYSIPCITLDTYCRHKNINYIDLMAIDIEGGELNAFKGATNILPNTKVIICELQNVSRMEGSPLRNDIIKFLEQYNFIEAYTTCKENFGDSIFINKNFIKK